MKKNNVDEKIELMYEAKKELLNYPMMSWKKKIFLNIKSIVICRRSYKLDRFFWPNALLAISLIEYGESESITEYFRNWKNEHYQIYYVDNIMNGYALLQCLKEQENIEFRRAVRMIYDFVSHASKDQYGSILYRNKNLDTILVDGVGMTAPFLCAYGHAYNNKESLELGIKQITNFLEFGMDEYSKLPYHGYNSKTKVKMGIIGWGRAVGWLLLALVDSIEFLDEKNCQYNNIISKLQDLITVVISYQRKDGSYSWQLQAWDGNVDTSVMAMIGYAIEKSLNLKIVNENTSILKSQEKLFAALESNIANGKVVNCSAECIDFSQYPQRYGAYPWSLAPTLRFATLYVKRNVNYKNF